MRYPLLPSRTLAVDVGASHVAGGIFTAGPGGKLLLRQFAFATHDSDSAPDARGLEQAGQSLAAVGPRLKNGGLAALGVPGHLALTKFVKTPAVPASKRGPIIEFEAAQNIPHPLDQIVWDHAVVATDGLDLEVMLAAAKTDAMEALCAAADAAGLPAGRATPSCLALAAAFRHNYPEVTGRVLLVDIGARSTHLVFLEAKRLFVRTLALAGNAVTQAIADRLQLGFAQAEALKIQVLAGRPALPADSPPRLAVQHAVETFGLRLQAEIGRSTVNYLRQSSAQPPGAVYLAGGGAEIPELPAMLREKLKLPVERLAALRRVELAAAAAGATDREAQLAGLVGLAARLASRPAWDANLLPARRSEALALRRREPWLAAAAAGVALALLAPLWRYHRAATLARERTTAIEAQLRPLRALQSRNRDNLQKLAAANRQVAALQGFAESKSNWVDFFADLQGRLARVQDVWLEKLSVRHEAPAGAEPAAIRLLLSGRLLDRNNPVAKVSADSYERVRRLLAGFEGSPFVAAVENERFDNSQPGILRFDFTLVVNRQHPL